MGGVVSWRDAQRRLRRALLDEQRVALAPDATTDEVAAVDLRRTPVDARPGPLRPVLLPLKRLVRQLLRPWLIDAQSEFNEAVAAALRLHGQRLARLEQDIRRIRQQLPEQDVAFDYQRFEDEFRGSSATIAARQRIYADYFDASGLVLDVGCGRGEFVELLVTHGKRAIGLDLDPALVAHCRERGLPVEQGDAIVFLRRQSAAEFGGMFVSQVVEHMPTEQLLALLSEAHRTLKPGGVLIIETINPGSWPVLSRWFPLDPTHVRLFHPDALRFLLSDAGFDVKQVELRDEVPIDDRFPTIDWNDAAAGFNERVEHINELLFGPLNYFVVAQR